MCSYIPRKNIHEWQLLIECMKRILYILSMFPTCSFAFGLGLDKIETSPMLFEVQFWQVVMKYVPTIHAYLNSIFFTSINLNPNPGPRRSRQQPKTHNFFSFQI